MQDIPLDSDHEIHEGVVAEEMVGIIKTLFGVIEKLNIPGKNFTSDDDLPSMIVANWFYKHQKWLDMRMQLGHFYLPEKGIDIARLESELEFLMRDEVAASTPEEYLRDIQRINIIRSKLKPHRLKWKLDEIVREVRGINIRLAEIDYLPVDLGERLNILLVEYEELVDEFDEIPGTIQGDYEGIDDIEL